jgi:hypothetical protein
MKRLSLWVFVTLQGVAGRAAADPISSLSAVSQDSTLIDFESVTSLPKAIGSISGVPRQHKGPPLHRPAPLHSGRQTTAR